jgi:hypothetical protein
MCNTLSRQAFQSIRSGSRSSSQAHGVPVPPRVANATQAQIDQAHATVNASIAQAAKLNEAPVRNPARNAYKLVPGTIIKRDSNDTQTGTGQPHPLPNITTEIANPAALIAEFQALNTVNGPNTCMRFDPVSGWRTSRARELSLGGILRGFRLANGQSSCTFPTPTTQTRATAT